MEGDGERGPGIRYEKTDTEKGYSKQRNRLPDLIVRHFNFFMENCRIKARIRRVIMNDRITKTMVKTFIRSMENEEFAPGSIDKYSRDVRRFACGCSSVRCVRRKR